MGWAAATYSRHRPKKSRFGFKKNIITHWDFLKTNYPGVIFEAKNPDRIYGRKFLASKDLSRGIF